MSLTHITLIMLKMPNKIVLLLLTHMPLLIVAAVKELLRKQGFSVQDDAALRHLASANTSTARRALAAIQGTTSTVSEKTGVVTANGGSASAQRRAGGRADVRGRAIDARAVDGRVMDMAAADRRSTDSSVRSTQQMCNMCILMCVCVCTYIAIHGQRCKKHEAHVPYVHTHVCVCVCVCVSVYLYRDPLTTL
jgi:hypothetical protein